MRRTLSSLCLLGALTGSALWLGTSESGLQAIAALAGSASGGRLHIEQASGSLLGPLNIASLCWQTPEGSIEATALHLEWSPTALLHGQLHLTELSAGTLHIPRNGSPAPLPLPTDIALPLTLDIDHFQLAHFAYGTLNAAHDIAGQLHGDHRQYRITEFRSRLGEIALSGEATLGTRAPLELDLSAEILSQFEQTPLALSLRATGPLERITLDGHARRGIKGQARLVLTPFSPAIFASAHIALDDIDPAAWQHDAPHAQLALQADITPRGNGLAGQISLANRSPGPLDRQRLPIEFLSGHLDWQDDALQLDPLKATLPGQGTLSGQAHWQAGQLGLTLKASRLDLARLVSTLRPSRLDGPLSATLSEDRQTLHVDLQDKQFRLQAEARHAAGILTLPRLELASGPARLTAKGELALAKDRVFSGEGTLRHFDPSRFAKLPAAQLNGRFKAAGQLKPRPTLAGHFTIEDSQLAGQPLSGHGTLSIDWPRLPQVDIELRAGPNRLLAHGALGQPGETLNLQINAPDLSAYGLSGDLKGNIELRSGNGPAQLAAQLQAGKLVWPERLHLDKLKLNVEAGLAANAPLLLDLDIARLGTPGLPDGVKQLHMSGEGSTAAHRLQARADLAGPHHLTLNAAGGIAQDRDGLLWRGQLLHADLRAHDPARNLHLTAPSPLSLGTAGWQLGPAQLAGDPLDWQATLQAGADAHQLHSQLSAHGSRIGQIDSQLSAGMQTPWTLNRQAPWQGKLSARINDLAWLGELIGETWQSAGRFSGELKLGGTPQHPVSSGQLRGEKLSLRLPEQGLKLSRGELEIDIQNNRLHVGKLGFDSELQTPPRALRLALTGEAADLAKKPGRLDISGEMQIDDQTGDERAFLDFRLDRFGAWQLPEQWVAVSGNGRLSWQDGTLGARGKLAVDAGYWQLARNGTPRLSDDVVIKRPGQENAPGSLRPKLDIDLGADLGPHFLFSGAGLDARLAGDIRLRASGRDLPRASGSIQTRDGRFDAYGQKLSIERGILTFQGLLDNPALDVRAVRLGLPVEPGVQISGSAQRPSVKLISDPELPDSEKLAWLVLGHGPEQMGIGDATVLLSAASGLLGNDSGGVVSQLKKGLGIDELGVRTGQIGDNGNRAPSSRVAGSNSDTIASTGVQIFSIGKRLSANTLLSYEQALGKAESIVKLTVSLGHQLSIVGRAGSDNALDLFYTVTFGREMRKRKGAT